MPHRNRSVHLASTGRVRFRDGDGANDRGEDKGVAKSTDYSKTYTKADIQTSYTKADNYTKADKQTNNTKSCKSF
jgi:hypothetical protein